MLAECGAVVIDADAISRQMTGPGGAAIAAIAGEFGAPFITSDGALNRDMMRELVFGDPAARLRLEAIVHPRVRKETQRQTLQARTRCIVFDVPLLVESGRWRQALDQVLVVDCSPAIQISRVMARNGWTEKVVLQVMAGQASREQRLAAADACISNGQAVTLVALAGQVRQLAGRFGL